MKPFFRTPKHKALVEKVDRRQAAVVTAYTKRIRAELANISAKVAEAAYQTGTLYKPNFVKVYELQEEFYKAVLTEAFYANKASEKLDRKRLSRKGPFKLAGTFRELEKLFRDRSFWPKIKKRAEKQADGLIDDYLRKLKKRFAIISPLLQQGEVTPQEVKQVIMDAGIKSVARVETVFRTETTSYFAKAQTEFYKGDDDILGYLFDSINDYSRTEICKSRHGLIYRETTDEHRRLLALNTPSCHYRCRSHLIPLANTERNRKMIEDPARDPTKVAVVDLPPGWNGQGQRK